ncbi:hypothetical protein [Pseudomonas aeruginosa]|uniref:hypothetical protein n=1 Tax=Pseudomonas aeruginosa TaxID=287 RepID=UPI003D7F7B12
MSLPGDGIISWLNRMLLPDTVGTGGDSHQRSASRSRPAPAVAFAAATGVMPLDMPESVLVRFKGKLQPGITLRDLVHAIPYYLQQGLLTVEKKGKKNIFSGHLPRDRRPQRPDRGAGLRAVRHSAERSAAGYHQAAVAIAEYLKSNITLLRWMIGEGYGDPRTLERRAQAMEAWLAKPELLEADKDANRGDQGLDLADVKEPVLCAPTIRTTRVCCRAYRAARSMKCSSGSLREATSGHASAPPASCWTRSRAASRPGLWLTRRPRWTPTN